LYPGDVRCGAKAIQDINGLFVSAVDEKGHRLAEFCISNWIQTTRAAGARPAWADFASAALICDSVQDTDALAHHG
jgi:hypothetical protein